MNPPPRVSVVIPVYNGERFLRETLDSVFAQTVPDIEVIAVDDGSTDGSRALLESVGDSRLRVTRQANQGAPSAMNTALKAARGEYIGFLDQDDLWVEEKLERHLACMDEYPGVDLTFSWYVLIDEQSREIRPRSRRWSGSVSFTQLLDDYVIGATSSVVMRRSALERAGRFDPTFPRYYDVDLFLRIALLGPGTVQAVPGDLTCYRRHGGQMSRDWARMRREWGRLLDKLRPVAPAEMGAVERRAWSNMNRYFARLAYEARDYRVAAGLLAAGLRSAPLRFLTDGRNWTTGAAVVSGLLLPEAIHRRLERLAGVENPRR